MAVRHFTPCLSLRFDALGLNILTGYAGQLALARRLSWRSGRSWRSFRVARARSPSWGRHAGALARGPGPFRLPSLRIKGLSRRRHARLPVLRAVGISANRLFTNSSNSGVINAQKVVILGYDFETRPPVHADATKARAHSSPRTCWQRDGRTFMAVRDMISRAAVSASG